jgi:nucleoside-diphosphate-sugar epimerase
VLVTGASGFVGSALIKRLCAEPDFQPVAGVRRLPPGEIDACQYVAVGNIDEKTDWSHALDGVSVVIHTAARVHMMIEHSSDPLAEYRHINVDGTLNIARQAAASGVKRFIFLSSIKVNGECTSTPQYNFLLPNLDSCEKGGAGLFSAGDAPAPQDPYAISKLEAEQGLLTLAAETGIEVVIVRPPLVYGPGVKANFLNMMRWLYRGIPLPFGAIYNKRSLVGLDNLVDLIVTCIKHPAAANQVFLVSDGEDLSTADLLRHTASVLGKSARLLPVPQRVMEIGLIILGKKDLARRLCGSLQVDINKTRKLLDWSPPVSVEEGLRNTADAFLRSMHERGCHF